MNKHMAASTDSGFCTVSTENVVMSADTEVELELEAIDEEIPQVQYNPEQFPGLIYRVHPLGNTVLLFRSGKLTSTGSNSVEEGKSGISKVVDKMVEIGVPLEGYTDLTVQNMVLSGRISKSNLNLNAVAIGLGLEVVEYEPEQFPGLIYNPESLEGVCLLFGSGKLVITGVVNVEQAEELYEHTSQSLDGLDLL